ncbi:uncharacterized protein N0V89_006223 [Didymosphaeria variabile]|uniref:Uncharacterized protein n=1 Tax=Didymosphaeria variabile TaxID=1932322 RepID=A0A9W9CB73_9PLEO|nr:uncharacterized protein N0V89_006223 [Didymosphaeria variabile]KAJ4354486.1 hypothetical protein N0V89_006223 [Didymosphaeria variabile]
MSGLHEEDVGEPDGEPEEIRMARLHSLLTKTKVPSSTASTPPKKNARRTQIALKDSQHKIAGQPRAQIIVFDQSPPRTPTRTHRKPSPRLTRAAWRAAAMFQYRQEAMEIRSQQPDRQADIFPFLALPVELRMAVYFELLVTDNRVLPSWRGPRKATKQQKRMYINILLTCKMCRDEGVQVLYGENIFDFGEICNRPNNFSKRFSEHIGPHNASLIRIVFAEYSAAAEELYHTDIAVISKSNRGLIPKTLLTVSHLRSFLSTFNIALSSLRLLAISIIPYGHDQATIALQDVDFRLMTSPHLRVKWCDAKNDKDRLGRLVDDICDREKGLMKADYWKDIDGWIGINFAPPSSGREWIVYQGVRGKEDVLEEGKEVGTEDEHEEKDSDKKASELVLHRR